MKYTNASKGLKLIVTAELLALAASILAVIMSVLAFSGDDAAKPDNFALGAAGIVMLVIIAMYVAAYVAEIFGITAASRDEPAFKVSLYAVIAMIVLIVASAFFLENETVYLMLSIAGDVAYFFFVHYIIHGIMHLSQHLGKPEFTQKGTPIFSMIESICS